MSTLEKLFNEVREKIGVVDNTSDPRFSDKVEEMRKKDMLVYHVIDGDYVLGETDEVHMTSYCFISKYDVDTEEDYQMFWENFESGIVFANVVNPTWDIEEMGSIGIKKVGSRLSRIY